MKEGCKGPNALGHGVEHHGLLSSSEARATHRAPSLGDFGMQLLWSAKVRADEASSRDSLSREALPQRRARPPAARFVVALPRAHLHALLVAATSRRGRRTSQKRSPGRVCMNGRGRRRRSLHSTLLRCQTDCGYAFEPHRRRSTLREHNSTNKKPTGSNPQCSCLGTALCAMVHRLVKLRSQFPVRTLWALRDACCANAPHP